MKIDPDIKLDFFPMCLFDLNVQNLLAEAKFHFLRTFKFKHSPLILVGSSYNCIGMDTTGTISMAISLQKYKIITCLHKYYTASEIRRVVF